MKRIIFLILVTIIGISNIKAYSLNFVNYPNNSKNTISFSAEKSYNRTLLNSADINAPDITVGRPTFNINSGTYNNNQTITITSSTTGAAIYYTTNNTLPSTTNGILYNPSNPIVIDSNGTILRARAYYSNTYSTERNATYSFSVALPTYSSVAGNYTNAQNVTISTITSGATIKYTTDGTDPSTSGTSLFYSSPVLIDGNTTLKAYAYKTDYTKSSNATGNYTFSTASPSMSPAGGNFTGTKYVILSSATNGASFRYTTINGQTPTETFGTLYTDSIAVTQSLNISAVAYKTGYTKSNIQVYSYNITVAPPDASPVAGTYNIPQTISLTANPSDANIRYTTDGSTPSATIGTIYTTPINISATTTLKAISYKTGASTSSVISVIYTIIPKVETPVFNPIAGTYSNTQTVSITTATTGSTIRYTIDGSTPTATTGNLYSTAISIAANTTLKAIAYKTGSANSDVASGSYIIKCAAPVMNPLTATYNVPQTVTLTSATTGVTIKYTTDGSTPSQANGTTYSVPFSVNSTATVKAIAYKTGCTDSDVSSATYTITLLPVSDPSFSPAAGTYSSAQSVTISTTTSGASIRYTTDGSTPTDATGNIYSSAITLSANTTLKAIAYKTNMINSNAISGIYNIKCAIPLMNIITGTYNTPQTIILTSSTSGATIRYTTDGSIPSQTNGTVYTTGIVISSTSTLKAIAYKTGMTDSDIASQTYTIQFLPAADPTFSSVPGTFATAQSVTISTTTSGAIIRYTTDGSTPSDVNGTLYAGAVSISANTTLKAVAYKTNMLNSSVISGVYNIKCAVPVMNPLTGTYYATQSVTLSSTTSGVTIRYTLDGSTPTSTTGTIYTSAISVAANATLKAIAYKSGMTDSDVASEIYTIINLPVANPGFSPEAGTYSSSQSIAISTATSGASIRYTTDGSTPSDINGTLYSTPVNISANTTLKAVAYKNNMLNSSVISGIYNIKTAIPVMNPAGGTFNVPQSVTITSATSGATIKYTTDGSTPSQTNGTVYTTAIAVNATSTLKAIAYKSGMTDSDIASELYTIDLLQVANPNFSPSAGTFSTAQTVTISSNTSGASIRYTIDGTTPSDVNGTLYSTPVIISANTTLKAIAYKVNMINSSVVTGVYYIKCVAPIMNPLTGTYNLPQSVTLTSSTSGATIRYTTDGSTPTQSNGTVYSGAITIGSTTTLKAISYKTGMTDSDISSEIYTIQFLPVAEPSFGIAEGTYNSIQSVSISTTTSGASIRYTTDGSMPSEVNGTLYTTAVSISANTTLKAVAYKTNMLNSNVISGIYNIKCATIVMNPTSGTYNVPQSVDLTSSTTGATIRYTTDGSTPTQSNGTVYSSAITIASTTTLKAIAYKTGMANGDISSETYTIQLLPVADPEFSPVAGTYNTAQSVNINSTTPGVSIRYTTDNSTPSEVNGILYTGSVNIAANTTIKAIAYKNNMLNSNLIYEDYNIKCTAPQISPSTGNYNEPQTITLTSVTTGASFRYTTDGSTPSETNGTLYTGAFTVNSTSTIKAVAFKTGMTESDIKSETLTIQFLPVTDPSFSLVSGTYNSAQSVTISSSTSGASIRYTTDGSTPSDVTGTLYSTPVSISENTTLKAIAYKTNMLNSNISSINYNIKCASVEMNPNTGTYNVPQTVTLTSLTSGATIKYTTDGSTPTQSNGTVYSGAITIGSTTTLKAIAYKSGMTDSDVSSESYTIQFLAVTDPSFTPDTGTYNTAQTITISSATSGATIRYTTDGTTPSETTGIIYSAPVNVSQNLTIKAIAYNTNMLNSNVVSGNFNIKCESPVSNVNSGTYNIPQSVSLSTNTSGATIIYTTDGTTPGQTNGTTYTAAININSNTTLNAIAYKSGFADSDPKTMIYVITNDIDGDGIGDANDEYPLDSARAFNNYFPANGFGSLAFEDSWPWKGDYDLNDVIVDYQFNNIVNRDNYLVETKATFILKASGASYNSGLGFQFANNLINNSDINVTGFVHNANYLTMNSNGTEANQNKPTIIVFDNMFGVLLHPGTGSGINTVIGNPYVTPVTLTILITYPANTYTETQLDITHFNPFIIVNKVRGKEVHLPNYEPTALVNTTLFGTGNDMSNPFQNIYYKSVNNLPWALNIYESFDYPIEKTPINEAYLKFIDWVISDGAQYTDWYKDISGNRNPLKIYTHPVQKSKSVNKKPETLNQNTKRQ